MVDNIGINILIPLLIFGFIIVGSMLMSGAALKDTMERRE